MTKPSLLFDASSILTLVRELRRDAADKLADEATISLAYYEVGNALWRECLLLKRISQQEAENLLSEMYAIIGEMKVTTPPGENDGNAILAAACKFNLTFYDSAYLAEADRSKSTLVTDDKKLAAMAQKAGVKTLTSKEFTH
jgi:predicted nucleic acid-binding protein